MTSQTSRSPDRAALLARLRDITTAMESTTLPSSASPVLALDLTVQQLKVLTVLVTSTDGASGRDLSATFGVTMASMSGLLDRLVARGVAEKTNDPTDQRVRTVRATPLGRTVVQKLVAARPEFDDTILAGLSLAELRALELGMAAVSRELRQTR
ncbi:MAG: MarR family winged helix-turn-helix transcriptional regulator [Specibacter sp.]